MRLKAASNFCRRMATGLRSGLDVLRLLESETKAGDVRHREVMKQVIEKIREGYSLHKAMASQKRYFPPLLIQMIGASELGGRMDHMFSYMADYYAQLSKTRQEFVGAISWPMIQLGLAIVIVGLFILLIGIILPNSDFDPLGLGLKGFGGFIVYCMVIGSVAATLAIVGYGLWKNWFQCHRTLVPLIQKIPVLGNAFVTLGLSRLSMTLSMLLNAGVNAQRALRQSFLSTSNYYYISGMEPALEAVERGDSFGDAFEASGVLPEEFIDSVRIGELSGTETESLDRLAEQYQEKASSALSTIAMIASVVIWVCVMMLLAFMILRIAFQILGVYSDALNDLARSTLHLYC